MSTTEIVSLCCRLFDGGGGSAVTGSEAALVLPMAGAYSVTAALTNLSDAGEREIMSLLSHDTATDLNQALGAVIDWHGQGFSPWGNSFVWELGANGTKITAEYNGTAALSAELWTAADTAPGPAPFDEVWVRIRKNGADFLNGLQRVTFPIRGEAPMATLTAFDPVVQTGDYYELFTQAALPPTNPVTLNPTLDTYGYVPNTMFTAERLSYGDVTYSLCVYDANDVLLRTVDTCRLRSSIGDARLAHACVMVPGGGKLRVVKVTDDEAIPVSENSTSHMEAIRVGPYFEPLSCDDGGGGGG